MTIEKSVKRLVQIKRVSNAVASVLFVAGILTSIMHVGGGWTPLLFAAAFSSSLIFVICAYYEQTADTAKQQAKISMLEQKATQEPSKASYAWDLARVKLETYFDRNLNQVKAIFWVAVVVMLAGFGFIVWGLQKAIATPDRVTVAMIGTASGIITQFVGVTFMTIYKNTMEQATRYVSVLERINTVGMAVQILDAIDEKSLELKDVTRVDIIRLLLAPASADLSFSPRSRKKKPGDNSGDKGEAANT